MDKSELCSDSQSIPGQAYFLWRGLDTKYCEKLGNDDLASYTEDKNSLV